jgi:RNA polymerase sigma factor (sigma-70 family)
MNKDKRSDLESAYRENRHGFLAWAAKATRSLVDAEDLVQDVFTAGLANAESLAGVDDLAAWLFTSLRNRVRDLWRHGETRRKAGEIAVSDAVITEIVASAGMDPAELAASSELMETLYEAIDELPDEQRTVIEAQVFDGLTFKELAQSSGISPDTLAARKRYALKRLAAALREWIEE